MKRRLVKIRICWGVYVEPLGRCPRLQSQTRAYTNSRVKCPTVRVVNGEVLGLVNAQSQASCPTAIFVLFLYFYGRICRVSEYKYEQGAVMQRSKPRQLFFPAFFFFGPTSAAASNALKSTSSFFFFFFPATGEGTTDGGVCLSEVLYDIRVPQKK